VSVVDPPRGEESTLSAGARDRTGDPRSAADLGVEGHLGRIESRDRDPGFQVALREPRSRMAPLNPRRLSRLLHGTGFPEAIVSRTPNSPRRSAGSPTSSTFIGEGGGSRTLADALVTTEKKVESLREELKGLRSSSERIFQAPPVEWIEERVAGRKEVLERRTEVSALLLRRLLGEIRLEPKEGAPAGKPYYLARTTLDTLALLEPPPGDPEGGSNSLRWWRRGESNPRPEMIQLERLQEYPSVEFSSRWLQRAGSAGTSLLFVSRPCRETQLRRYPLLAAFGPTPQGKGGRRRGYLIQAAIA
jgi:hypothetical protein